MLWARRQASRQTSGKEVRSRPPAGGRVRKNFFGRPGLKRFLLASRQQENCSEIPQPGARQFWNLGFTLEMLGPCSAKSGRLEFGQQICEFATAFFSRVPAGCRNPKLRSVDFRILAAFFLHDSPAVIYAKKKEQVQNQAAAHAIHPNAYLFLFFTAPTALR